MIAGWKYEDSCWILHLHLGNPMSIYLCSTKYLTFLWSVIFYSFLLIDTEYTFMKPSALTNRSNDWLGFLEFAWILDQTMTSTIYLTSATSTKFSLLCSVSRKEYLRRKYFVAEYFSSHGHKSLSILFG